MKYSPCLVAAFSKRRFQGLPGSASACHTLAVVVIFAIVRIALSRFPDDDSPIPDVIPLTSQEKKLKAQLESVVEGGLAKFLEVGAALAELRSKRLYRREFGTFERYVSCRFALHRSAVDSTIRASQVAETLRDAGIKLPADTTATSLRAVSALPGGDELKVACWQLAASFSPGEALSEPHISRLCRLVRNCLEERTCDEDQDRRDDQNGGRSGYQLAGSRRQTASLARETPFIRPVERLAAWSGFSVEVIVSSVSPPSASTLFRACEVLTDRLRQVQEKLVLNYPELVSDA